MPLRAEELRVLVAELLRERDGRSQNDVARMMKIEPSALSRWLTDGGASYQLVRHAARALGVPVERLWEGKIPKRYQREEAAAAPPTATPGRHAWNDASVRAVPRGTQTVDPEAALRAIEQMEFAMVDMARQAIRFIERGPERPDATPPAGNVVDAEAVGMRARQAATEARDRPSHHSAPSRRRKGGG